MASGDIVPIELGLTDGDLVTLWAPRWREGDDEWEALLGHDEALYGFGSVAELAAFIRGNEDNDLVDHPAWKVVAGLSAEELEPDEEHSFDLIGVPELVSGDPDEDTVAELADTLAMARTIGEVCELDTVTKFFSANLAVGALASGSYSFLGREGAGRWDRVGAAVAKGWDDVVDAIDSIIATPEVDAQAVAVAEAELLAAAENVVDTDELTEDEQLDLDADDLADTEYEDADTEPDEEESFWQEVGIDPIRIVTSGNTFYTLRCYLDDEPIFLGRAGSITVLGSERALARYLVDARDHDLAQVSTFSEVQTAAIDGSLDVEVTEENVYVLPGLAEDLAEGPEAVDADQLDLIVELLTDAADWAGDDSVNEALAPSTPLGWYVSYLLNPEPTRMAPSPPFTAEAESWRALERALEARLAPQ